MWYQPRLDAPAFPYPIPLSVLHSHLFEILGMAGASPARESLPHIANPSRGRIWGMFNPDKRRSGEIPAPFPLWEAQQGILRSSDCSWILCVRVKWGFVVVHEGWARLWESLVPKNGKWLPFFISSLFKQLIFCQLQAANPSLLKIKCQWLSWRTNSSF